MLIKDDALQHWIENFYGYGSWRARFWFVAYEEGGGDLPDEVAEKFDYFRSVHATATEATLCDIRQLYRNVAVRTDALRSRSFNSLYEYRFGGNAVLHGVWKNLIAFAHGYQNEALPALLDYQRKSFASPSDGREALIPLYPLPSPHNHAWYYSWLDMPQFPFLKSRTLYEEYAYGRRMRRLLQNMSLHRPELVLMYGMNNINMLKASVQEFFPAAKFKLVKAIKQQTPQHHRADFNGITILVTTQIPTLRHNRPETGFDWYGFGRAVNLKTSP